MKKKIKPEEIKEARKRKEQLAKGNNLNRMKTEFNKLCKRYYTNRKIKYHSKEEKSLQKEIENHDLNIEEKLIILEKYGIIEKEEGPNRVIVIEDPDFLYFEDPRGSEDDEDDELDYFPMPD